MALTIADLQKRKSAVLGGGTPSPTTVAPAAAPQITTQYLQQRKAAVLKENTAPERNLLTPQPVAPVVTAPPVSTTPGIGEQIKSGAQKGIQLGIAQANPLGAQLGGVVQDVAKKVAEGPVGGFLGKVRDYLNKEIGGFELVKTAYAPAEENSVSTVPTPDGGTKPVENKTLETLVKEYEKSPRYEVNRKSNIFVGNLVEGLTGGILKPESKAPKDLTEKVVAGIGNIAGSVVALGKINQAVGGILGGTTIGSVLSKYPLVEKFVQGAVTFDIYGQLDPDIQNRLEKVVKDTVLAVPYSMLGFVKSPIKAVPASFGLVFGLSKLEGASNEDAFVNATIFTAFEASGRLAGEKTITEKRADGVMKTEAVGVLNKYSSSKITPESSPAEIRSAYLEAVKATHPDTGGTPEAFKSVATAYEFLTGKRINTEGIDPNAQARAETPVKGQIPATAQTPEEALARIQTQALAPQANPVEASIKKSNVPEAVTQKQAELKKAYEPKIEATQQALSEVLMELDIAEAGKRIFIENPDSSSPTVMGIKSTFPSWVPEDLRSKDLFEKVMAPLASITDNPQFPEGNRPKQRELMNLILDEIDSRAGIDTSQIRSDIMSAYAGETTQQVTEGANRSVAGGQKPTGESNPFLDGQSTKPTVQAGSESKPQPVKKELYDYKSTQLDLPSNDAKEVKAFSAKIPDSELYNPPNDPTFGREEHPHVTVLYGIDKSTIDEVRAIVQKEKPITVKLGEISTFDNKEKSYQVLKVDVNSPELTALNEKLRSALDVAPSDFKDYKPHVTVAYVKEGEAAKYTGDKTFDGKEITIKELSFQEKDGTGVSIPLKGEVAQADTSKPSVVSENKNTDTTALKTADIPHEDSKSRLQERVEAQILDQNGDKYDFNPDTGKYNKITLKGDAEKALDLLKKDPEKALRIARGFEDAPEGQTSNNIAMAVAMKARAEGNIDLFTELINKTSLRSTKFGQEIVTLRGNFNDNSPENWMRKVLNQRIENLGGSIVTEAEKALGKKTSAKTKAVEKIDREVSKLQERISSDQVKIKSAQDIIDSLKCL